MSVIEKVIIDAIQKSIKEIFPRCPEKILSNIYLEVPKEKKFGDFSTNAAMRLAGKIGRMPQQIAFDVVDRIKKIQSRSDLKDLVCDIKVEGPGFINFYISGKAVIGELARIIGMRERFGRLRIGKRRKIQIEFVSANPTGPLTVAHGRQAAVGDSLGRILEFCGYRVTREYYINDEGLQIDLLGASVKSRFMELTGEKSDFPEDGYKGSYIYDIAREIKQKLKTRKRKQLSDTFFAEYACRKILAMIKNDLDDFGVRFDIWFSQRSLSGSGKIEKALEHLRKGGYLYERDGAIWFKSTAFGDDKDRVVIKNDGSYTYLAPDIAYHMEKFKKGYVRVINIWGPDHHGYVKRIKAACQALGISEGWLSVLISQLVTIYRDRKPVRMSTRAGEFITLREVIGEVGKDAARFFFLMRKTDSHLDFDIELAKSKSMDNPVYYIQYAHARIASVIKFARKGIDTRVRLSKLSLLDKSEEIDIIKKLIQFPKIIESAARNLEPYILLVYLQELSILFHSYYDSYRIVSDDKRLSDARLALVRAIKVTLSNGLNLLGVTAPEKM